MNAPSLLAASLLSIAAYDQSAGPGAAVLVMHRGQVLHRQGYGLADIAEGKRIDAKTRFNLASLSKQFTAMAAAILIEEKKLRLEDRVMDLLPGFPAYAREVRVRHLIHHTSGLPDYMKLCAGSGRATSRDVLEHLRGERALLFPAGSSHLYSNTGYVILALVIERASGTKFGDFLKKRVFVPLGMKGTFVEDPERLVAEHSVPDRARGYRVEGGKVALLDSNPCDSIFGDGAVYSSLEDLEKWWRSLELNVLLKKSALVFGSGTTDDGKPVDYGYGWKLESSRGFPHVFHTGSWTGYRNIVGYVPKDRLWVAILSNRTDIERTKLVNAIEDELRSR